MNAKLLGLACAVVLLVSAFVAGDKRRDNAWLASLAVAERAAAKQYLREVKRGDDATASLVAVQRQHTANYRQFERQFNELRSRNLLLVNRVPNDPAVGLAAGVEPGNAGQGDAGSGQLVLSAGALWMWNTALAGSDVPAGACGAVGTATAACSVATSLTVDDAWTNHAINAEICSANRLAHQQLIDFLKARERANESPKP